MAVGLAALTAAQPIFTSTTNPAALRVRRTLMAATRKTAMPPPLLPPLETGIASTGEETSVHNNRYKHKHYVKIVNVRGQEKVERGKKMLALKRKIYNEELREKFKFCPNFRIIV